MAFSLTDGSVQVSVLMLGAEMAIVTSVFDISRWPKCYDVTAVALSRGLPHIQCEWTYNSKHGDCVVTIEGLNPVFGLSGLNVDDRNRRDVIWLYIHLIEQRYMLLFVDVWLLRVSLILGNNLLAFSSRSRSTPICLLLLLFASSVVIGLLRCFLITDHVVEFDNLTASHTAVGTV